MLETKRKLEHERNGLQREMDKLTKKDQQAILNKGNVRGKIQMSFGKNK